MTQVLVNGHLYSDDGSTSRDMLNGGHRTWLLPMISDLMVEINAILGGSITASYNHVRPVTGATITATPGLSSFAIEPAGTIAALNVVLPATPVSGQIFELGTTQTITAISVTSPDGGVTVERGTEMLSAGGGMSWRYVSTDSSWHRRY